MFYTNELDFLCEILKKNHIGVIVANQSEICKYMDEYQSEGLCDPRFSEGGNVYSLLGRMEQQTLYRLTDVFYRHFICFVLPESDGKVILIGPVLPAKISDKELLLLGEEMRISPQKQRYLGEYYSSMPVLPPDSPIMTMINTFCELIWSSPSFAIEKISREHTNAAILPPKTAASHNQNDTLVNIKALEARYAFENELLRSVSLGQLHMEDRFVSAFSTELFEKRTSDPLRNAKNYAIIMNTLLRKAAENGGVHPLHLDQVSSDFARKIEMASSLAENTSLMRELFKTYCRLVRRHALKSYSPVIKRTLLLIDADLCADLCAGTLAANQGVSLGYLSSLFHKEVGKTISAYVRERRMEHACHLLDDTDLQIQTVALHCGILDVQYFTKLFKKEIGMTPSAYKIAKSEQKEI